MIWKKYPEQKPNQSESVLVQCLTSPLVIDDDGLVVIPTDYDYLYLTYFEYFNSKFSNIEWEDSGFYAWLVPLNEEHEPTWVKFEDKFIVAWMRVPGGPFMTEEEATAHYEKYFKDNQE